MIKGWFLLERAVLGALMEFPHFLSLFTLREEWFEDVLHRRIFEAVCVNRAVGKPFDRFFMLTVFDDNPDLKREVLECWNEKAFSETDFDFYRKELQSLWASRVVQLQGQRLIQDPELLAEAMQILQDAQMSKLDDEVEIVSAAEAKESHLRLRASGELVISTGDKPLDRLLSGGWRAGFYAVCARPKHGKSTVLLYLARRLAESGRFVLFVTLEMPTDQVMDRLLGAVSRVEVTKISQNLLSDSERRRIDEARLPDSLKLVAPVDRTVEGLRLLIDRMEYRFGRKLDAVFVDYPQIMDDIVKHNNPVEKNAAISGKLQKLSQTEALPIITALQFKREESASKKHMTINDIAESDRYGRDISGALMMRREFMPGDDTEFGLGSELLLEIEAHRFGPQGLAARYKILGEYTDLEEYPFR